MISVPAGAGTCGLHLHWEVRRESTNEFVNPMTCNISNHIYVDNATYTARPCDPSGFCPASRNLSAQTFDGFGTFRVVQSFESITADTVAVQNYASVVFHAADRVRLLPGFRAGGGNAYFRAEIGPCNTTAQSPRDRRLAQQSIVRQELSVIGWLSRPSVGRAALRPPDWTNRV